MKAYRTDGRVAFTIGDICGPRRHGGGENGKVTYASAGHYPPVLAKAGERPRVMPDLIREHQFIYESGTLPVSYTDGLIEFSHNADEGKAPLLRAARDAVETGAAHPAQDIVENVLHKEQRYPDDVAVFTIFFT